LQTAIIANKEERNYLKSANICSLPVKVQMVIGATPETDLKFFTSQNGPTKSNMPQ